MENLALLRPDSTAQINIGELLQYNQMLQVEIKRFKQELSEAKATIYQQQKTIANQTRTIREQNKKVISMLEKDRIVLNKDKQTFVQVFNMKCPERGILAHLKKFLNTDPTWDNLNTENLQRFEMWLRKSAIGRSGRLLNDSTVCTYIAHLKQIIKYGYTNSQDSSLALKSTKPAKKKKVWLKPSDIRKLIAYTPIDEVEKRVIAAFLICSIVGCRISDVATLKIENIDGNTLRYVPIKTKNQECFVKLSSEALELLKELLQVDVSEVGTVDGAVLKNIFRKIGYTQKVEIGTPNKPDIVEFCDAISFHTARRSFATILYRYSQLSEREIALSMGHSSFNQTFETYIADKTTVSEQERLENQDVLFC